jgi:hypothetical protein
MAIVNLVGTWLERRFALPANENSSVEGTIPAAGAESPPESR